MEDIDKKIKNMELIIAMRMLQEEDTMENRNRMINEMMKSGEPIRGSDSGGGYLERYLPFGVHAYPPYIRRSGGLWQGLYHLRHRRHQEGRGGGHEEPQDRREAVPPQGGHYHHQPCQG